MKLVSRAPRSDGQTLSIDYDGRSYNVSLPLAGSFQASNALVAAGLAIGLGDAPAPVFAALEHLKGAPGRLERVATAQSGAPIYVDYAHTPDALETVLTAIRPHVAGKLHVVFGCGGDRDRGKRPLMGKAAADKGHETGQIIGAETRPFSDKDEAVKAALSLGGSAA